MIYELRIYHAMPGKLKALSKRFETTTVRFWDKHGIRPVGFWTPAISNNSNDLYYLLAWENLGERETKWNAFQNDPDWIQARAESEQDGVLYSHITNVILTPTSFSELK
jgi:hypothetical protein